METADRSVDGWEVEVLPEVSSFKFSVSSRRSRTGVCCAKRGRIAGFSMFAISFLSVAGSFFKNSAKWCKLVRSGAKAVAQRLGARAGVAGRPALREPPTLALVLARQYLFRSVCARVRGAMSLY